MVLSVTAFLKGIHGVGHVQALLKLCRAETLVEWSKNRARVGWPVRQCRHLMVSDAWAHLFAFLIEKFGHTQSLTVFYNSEFF